MEKKGIDKYIEKELGFDVNEVIKQNLKEVDNGFYTESNEAGFIKRRTHGDVRISSGERVVSMDHTYDAMRYMAEPSLKVQKIKVSTKNIRSTVAKISYLLKKSEKSIFLRPYYWIKFKFTLLTINLKH